MFKWANRIQTTGKQLMIRLTIHPIDQANHQHTDRPTYRPAN